MASRSWALIRCFGASNLQQRKYRRHLARARKASSSLSLSLKHDDRADNHHDDGDDDDDADDDNDDDDHRY